MRNLINYNFNPEKGLDGNKVEMKRGETVIYYVEGETNCCSRRLIQGTEPVTTEEYVVLTYRAEGWKRISSLCQKIICGVVDGKEIPIFSASEMVTDGATHRVIAHTGVQTYDYLRMCIYSSLASMKFEIIDFYTCSYDELPKRYEETGYGEGFKCIDIQKECNDFMSDTPAAIDSGIGKPSGKLGLYNIPFRFAENGAIIRCPAGPDEINDEIIDNFITKTKRKLCRPESRESRFTVSVNDYAKEVYFALYLDKFMNERCGFCAPDPTILGSSQGEVLKPLCINDIERFAVLVNYEDGSVDECLPTSVKTGRHEIIGEFGVYGVKTLNKKIESISFEDRLLDTDISLAALTLNQSADELFGEMFPQRVKTAKKSFDKPASVKLDGDILTVANGGFELVLNTKDGLFVERATSAYCPTFKMSGAILKVRDEKKLYSELERVETEISDIAKIVYRYQDLYISVFFDPSEKDGVSMRMKVLNKGNEEKSIGVLFPILDNVEYRSPEDTWYFLPKYQNTESNGSCNVYEESAPSYPMQFMDIFSPEEGAGLALTTRERDLKVRKYALLKDRGVTTAFIEYPDMYFKLSPNAVFCGSETTLFTHEGDWHESYKSYKKWLDSWYEPYNCQDKKWYRQLFWLVAELDDFVEDSSVCKFPVWYNKETGEYRFQTVMDTMTEIYGETPDILHLWGWTWHDEIHHFCWGNFGGEDYDRIGGLENFRNALNDCSKKTGAEISLYVHPTLLTNIYPKFEKYYPEYCVKTERDTFISLHNDSFRMCHAEREWRNEVLDMYKNLYKDMGTRLFYVDEFSLRVDNRCWNTQHSHEMPSNLLKTDRTFITALKDETPKDIALYGEYYAVDVNARYIDCNISYYILDSINDMIEQGHHGDDASDKYGRVFTDIYRFAFPKIVQLILPMGMRKLTWQPLKATFFNGEAIYDSFWDAEETRGRKFMAKSYHLKKEYADCFSSDTPETMIESENDAICVNKFPGDNRTVYTIFNRSYHTYSGNVIKVPYKEGAKYLDIWNGTNAEFEVKDGFAYIKTRVVAQSCGAIAEIL